MQLSLEKWCFKGKFPTNTAVCVMFSSEKAKNVKMKENAEKKNVNEVHVTKWQHEQSSCHDNDKGIQFLINIFDEDLYRH